jgi:hypothetical protein
MNADHHARNSAATRASGNARSTRGHVLRARCAVLALVGWALAFGLTPPGLEWNRWWAPWVAPVAAAETAFDQEDVRLEGASPLPSDQEMIENFRKHRTDFGELVRMYQAYQRDEAPLIESMPEGRALLEKLGLDRVVGHGDCWPPPPHTYPADPAEAIKWCREHSRRKDRAEAEGIWFEPKASWSIYRRNGIVYKRYSYLPQPPLVENEVLIWPGRWNSASGWHQAVPIVDTTDRFRAGTPAASRLSSTCRVRPLEAPHWYIALCTDIGRR